MTSRVTLLLRVLLGCLALLAAFGQAPLAAQDTHISARLVAEAPPQPGSTFTVALVFDPDEGWHGYWSNPGDAGYGMELDWTLPAGWEAGEPKYPVPQRLVIEGLMNHVYEGPYAVLVPITVPVGASLRGSTAIGLSAQWLACTDEICVPEQAELSLYPARANPAGDARFGAWRAAIPPALDRPAQFEIADGMLRLGIPLPQEMSLADPHVFVETANLVRYDAGQRFARDGDTLVVEIPLDSFGEPGEDVTGILAMGGGNGVSFTARRGPVPAGTEDVSTGGNEAAVPLWLLLVGALAGGLLLNVMPCVFPILSLKALALARAGGESVTARTDAVAYTAGAVIASLALGAALLALRAAGEQVGWAFQLQEPKVVLALFLLAVAITANFLGLFDIPGLAISGGRPSARGSFATGLLAAFVATPCTGPFMAAALGAALVLPPLAAMGVFAALGLGLALPFLLIGFVPAIRSRLPRPGPWMERFRRLMAIPMGMTALALGWLLWRLGGWSYLAAIAVAAVAMLALLLLYGRSQRGRPGGGAIAGLAALAAVALALLVVPAPQGPAADSSAQSLLAPRAFSEVELAEARASGRPVFLWFTADWCVTCKVNERVAIEREATRAAFERAGVVSLRGDWTLRDAEIAGFLDEHGAAGVPLYLWYPPGEAGEQLPQVLTASMLVERAERAERSGASAEIDTPG